MNSIGYNIRRYRELRKYSQEYMASKLDLTQGSYAKIERQETKLTVERLQQIAEALEVDLSLLLNTSAPTIFNQYDNNTANGHIEKLHNNLPEHLIAQYQDQIKHLKAEVAFLRGLVK